MEYKTIPSGTTTYVCGTNLQPDNLISLCNQVEDVCV